MVPQFCTNGRFAQK